MDRRNVAISSGIGALTLALCGCAASSPMTSPSPSEPPIDAGTPSASPPATRSADSPLDALDAYLACRVGSWNYAADEPTELSWQPFAGSYVVSVDGVWRVYSEYVRTPKDGSAPHEGAAMCKFGGTIGEPTILRVGAFERTSPEDDSVWADEVP